MKVTALTAQQKDPNRINVMVDSKYRFSLDISQVVSLGVKVGREYSDAELAEIEGESQFGKLYARALEYCLMRPHSAREVRDYLWRKTRETNQSPLEKQPLINPFRGTRPPQPESVKSDRH